MDGGTVLGNGQTLSPVHMQLIASEFCGLKCVPQKGMFKSQPWTSKCDSICKKDLCRCHWVKMRLHWVRKGPSAMTGVLIRGGNWDTKRQTSEGEGDGQVSSSWRGVSGSQWIQALPATSESGREDATDTASECPKDIPCRHLNMDFWPPDLWEKILLL